MRKKMSKKVIISLLCIGAVILAVIYYLSYRNNPPRQAAQQQEVITSSSEGNSLLPNESAASESPSKKETDHNQSLSSIDSITTQSASASKVRITGRVLFEEGGAASGAAVQLFTYGVPTMHSVYVPKDTLIASTAADAEGKYNLEIADNPVLRIAASLKGRAVKSEMLINEDYFRAPNLNVNKTREVSKDLVLPQVAELSGKVINENGEPVAGVLIKAVEKTSSPRDVSFIQSETQSKEDGSFVFGDLAKGLFIVKASKPGYTDSDTETSAPARNLVLQLGMNGASLEGFVFMKTTGQGVAGAKITLIQQNRRMFWITPQIHAVSDDKGAYHFENVPEGEYMITAGKDNLFMWRGNPADNGRITLAAKENKKDYDIFLFPGYTIRGTVTLQGSKEPIDGVEIIQAMNANIPIRGVTGADGKYEIANVPEGMWMLKAQKKGYIMVSNQRGWQGVQVTLPKDSMEAIQNFEMEKALTISGIVKDESGAPVMDAKVIVITTDNIYQLSSLNRLKTYEPVNEKGEFIAECPPNQTVLVRASSSRFPDATSDSIIVNDQSVTGIVLIMKAGATISGRVVDPEGKPVQEALVVINDQIIIGIMGSVGYRKNLRTDKNGQFTVSDVPIGTIKLFATAKGFAQSERQTLELASGEMKTDVVLKLRTTHYIAGKVTDADGNPLSQCYVFAKSQMGSSHGSAMTGEDGLYRIEGLSDDKHYVYANSNEGTEQKENVSVDRDDVNFIMGKNPVSLIGIVLDGKTREPLKDFSVSSKSSDISPEKNPDKVGVFTAKKIKRGHGYSITIEAPGCMTLEKNFVVPTQMEDNILEMTFEMGGGCSIGGRFVEKETHNPVAGAQFAIIGKGNEFWQLNRANPIASVRTGEDGRFLLEKIEPGPMIVSFVPPEPYMQFDRRLVGDSLAKCAGLD